MDPRLQIATRSLSTYGWLRDDRVEHTPGYGVSPPTSDHCRLHQKERNFLGWDSLIWGAMRLVIMRKVYQASFTIVALHGALDENPTIKEWKRHTWQSRSHQWSMQRRFVWKWFGSWNLIGDGMRTLYKVQSAQRIGGRIVHCTFWVKTRLLSFFQSLGYECL